MPSITAYRPLRLLCDLGNPNRVLDQRTALPPIITRGSATGFELALGSDGAVFAAAITGTVASLTVQVRAAADPGSDVSIERTISTGFNDALTQALWNSRDGQHAVVSFTTAQCNLAAGTYWLTIWFTTASAEKVIVLSGEITVVENGAGVGSAPALIPPGYTTTEADARFARLTPPLGAYRVRDTGTGVFLQLKASDTGLFHTVFVTAGALTLGPGES